MKNTDVARGLMQVAIDIAAGTRPRPIYAHLYQDEDGKGRARVPQAFHSALCSRIEIPREDADHRVWLCDWCGLAVEWPEVAE